MYNKAHTLANAMRESKEFQEYRYWHQLVMKDEKNKAMVEDYQKKIIAIQYVLMEGKEPDAKKMEELRALEGILTANSTVKSFLEAQMRFSTIYADIQKILSDAIEIPAEESESTGE